MLGDGSSRYSVLTVFLALAVTPVAAGSPLLLYHKVALTGEPAPGTEAGTTFAIFTTGLTDFFLVVPNVGGFEGGYGVDSAGHARPAAAEACFPQGEIDVCAP